MKKNLFRTLVAAMAVFVASCTSEGNGGGETALNPNFDINPAKPAAGASVSFQSTTTGGSGNYTYKWTVDNKVQSETSGLLTYTFKTGGAFVVRLDVTDGSGKSAYKRKTVVVAAPAVAETGELTLNWLGKMMGYSTISTPAIADDGSIYSTCRNGKLYKWSTTGSSVWEREIWKESTAVSGYGTPVIDTDGTIFISGGDGGTGNGVLKAFAANGTEKWKFTEWYRADGSTPAPSCTATLPSLGTTNLYFGHTGQNGIVASINKATGKRNGFAAPAGGARQGIALTSTGKIAWMGGTFGLFGMSTSTIDNSGNTPMPAAWRIFGDGVEKSTQNPMGGMALTKIDGKYYICGIATDERGTKVYAVSMDNGEALSVTYIEDTEAQDQGGVVIDADGNIVAALNNTLGSANGGVVVVNPKNGQVVCRYRTAEKVSGSPAIDKAGNIHFGTESGYYYVVNPEGSDCELLVKRNLADIILADARYKNETHLSKLYTAKIWCSPVIGDDGKIFITFTDDETRAFGGLVCLSYAGCKGPAASNWPMYGQNRRHTNTF
ncbi:MAG: PQQ-binding-like beta-propeller repeat protein [Bacteroidales bacterium]|nr:PQQ-binding-like beta-propeller repeat protein [Bacteroidales bacterium]